MLDGGEHYACAHQRSRITAVRHRLDVRGNLEPTQIGATKHVTRVRRRRDESNVNRNSGVQSYSVSFDRRAERSLFDQM